MPPRPEVTWGDAAAFFGDHGFIITPAKGGDKKIKAPSVAGKQCQIVVLGHRYCVKRSNAIAPGWLGRFQRAFGVTPHHIAGSEEWSTDMLPDREG